MSYGANPTIKTFDSQNKHQFSMLKWYNLSMQGYT